MRWLLRFFYFVFRHKYIVTLLVFGVVIGFTDSNSLYVRYRLHDEINRLQSQVDDYNARYERDKELLELLDSEPRAMEKIARERFFMKKPDEDVYIIQ